MGPRPQNVHDTVNVQNLDMPEIQFFWRQYFNTELGHLLINILD